MDRQDLPRPTSFNDMYLYDICMSLRALVDASTPTPAPAPALTDLREPAPVAQAQPAPKAGKPGKMVTHDDYIRAEQATGASEP